MDGTGVFFSRCFPDLNKVYSDSAGVTEASLVSHHLQGLPLGLFRHSEKGASALLRNHQHLPLQPLLALSCLPYHPLQKLLPPPPPPSRWSGCRGQAKENAQPSFLLSWDTFLPLGITFETSK